MALSCTQIQTCVTGLGWVGVGGGQKKKKKLVETLTAHLHHLMGAVKKVLLPGTFIENEQRRRLMEKQLPMSATAKPDHTLLCRNLNV